MRDPESLFAFGISRREVLTEVERRLALPRTAAAQASPRARRRETRALKHARDYLTDSHRSALVEVAGLCALFFLADVVAYLATGVPNPALTGTSAGAVRGLVGYVVLPALLYLFLAPSAYETCRLIAADLRAQREEAALLGRAAAS
jgi:hypothetical protein